MRVAILTSLAVGFLSIAVYADDKADADREKILGNWTVVSGQEDGKAKIFRDSAVENLTEFFDRFGKLSIGSSEQLNEVIAHAKDAIAGKGADVLRKDQSLRDKLAEDLAGVRKEIDKLMIDRPKRLIELDDEESADG